MQRWEQFNQCFGKEDSLEKQTIEILIEDILHQVDWQHMKNLLSLHAGTLEEVVYDTVTSFCLEHQVDAHYETCKDWLQQEVENNAE